MATESERAALREKTPLLSNRMDGGPPNEGLVQESAVIDNDYSKVKRYLKYLFGIIILVLLIEGAINYHKIMDRFKAYMQWVRIQIIKILIYYLNKGINCCGHTRRTFHFLLTLFGGNHLFDSLDDSIGWSWLHIAHRL